LHLFHTDIRKILEESFSYKRGLEEIFQIAFEKLTRKILERQAY